MTEHWLTNNIASYLNNSGLTFISGFFRETGERGGSCILVSKDLYPNTKELSSFVCMASKYDFEVSAAEIILRNEILLLICIYRVPNRDNLEIFLNKLEALLSNVLKYKTNKTKKIILGGDFNIDILKEDNCSRKYLDLIASYGLTANIKVATRITTKTKTCIDNIFTNFKVKNANVEDPGLSDHTAQSITIPTTVINSKSKTFRRKFSENQIFHFKNLLEEEDWSELYSFNLINNPAQCVNSLYTKFLEIFMQYFNTAFPKQPVFQKNTILKKKWVTDEIIKLSTEKRTLYLSWKQNLQNKNLEFLYKTCKSTLRKKIQHEKLQNNISELNKSGNMSKASWGIVNRELGKLNDFSTNKAVELVNINGEIEKSYKMANSLNIYFSSVGEHLGLDANPVDSIQFSKFYRSNINESLFLSPVTPNEVTSVIKQVKNKMTSGWDEIPMVLVKHVSNSIASPLAFIFNHALSHGVFPDLLKYSIITPIKKNTGTPTLDNFRPISLLPIFSNLLERLILNRLLPFLNKNNIINKEQFGFTEKLSTVDAIHRLTDLIYNSFDKKMSTAAIFCDLSKAFDTMDRNILLQKLELYGIRGTPLNLFKSYFSNRFQRVKIMENGNISFSDWTTSTKGCPQGSILGPVLFLIYVADLSAKIKLKLNNCKIIQYADDTSAVIETKEVSMIKPNVDACINLLNEWFSANGMALNKTKTQTIKFYNHISSIVNCTDTAESHSIKFLGVFIDAKLNFNYHYDHIAKKLNSSCFVLNILSNCVDYATIKNVYYATFQSIMGYGLIIWGGSNSTNLNRIFKIQKRAIRIIHNKPFNENCKQIFISSKILTLPSLYILEIIKYFYKNKENFSNKVLKTHNTRGHFLPFPSHSCAKIENSTFYMTCRIINKIYQCNKYINIDHLALKKIKNNLEKKRIIA